MKNKDIIVAILLMVSGVAWADKSGQSQGGVLVPTKLLIGGVAVATTTTIGGLWYLKRRLDWAESQLNRRDQEIQQDIEEKQMNTLRAAFYALGDALGWVLGFHSGYMVTTKLFARYLWFSSQPSQVEIRDNELKRSVNHANLKQFSLQISPGWFSSSRCNPNAEIEGESVVHHIIKKQMDQKNRLRWMQCLAQNSAVKWDKPDSEGFTALHRAVTQGDVALVHFLRARGARPDRGVSGGRYDGLTALHYVASIEDGATRMAIAHDLLKAPNIDMEVRSVDFGHTPLATAATLKRADLMRLYLAHGALKDARDNNSRTILSLAQRSGSSGCVSLVR